jgi:hypothetical protein
MVAKLSAVWLVVLCILPMTAPFSTLGSLSPVNHQSADAVIGEPHATFDSDDVLALERSTFLQQSRLCATGIVAFHEIVLAETSFPPTDAQSSVTTDSRPRSTILRL